MMIMLVLLRSNTLTNGKEMKKRSTACLWALFTGGIGGHHFYLGNKRAMVYLLFCWTGIPVFVAFLELITWLFNDEKVFNEKYNLNTVQMANLIHLEKLFELKQKGIITEEEFQKKKMTISI